MKKERKDLGKISSQTANYYLKSMKQFCRWMVNDGRASISPIEHLQPFGDGLDIRHERRALEPDEIRLLLERLRGHRQNDLE
jgi:integrase